MRRILSKILIILILAGMLGGGVYYMFFMDKPLRDLGYTAAEIEKLRAHKITDKVTIYNPGLIAALDSEDFIEENMEYYISIKANTDVTKDINDLAKKYTIEEVKSLADVLKPSDLYALVFLDKINDIELYKQYYIKGYDYQTSVTLANDLNCQYAKTLMDLPLLEYKEVMAYLTYSQKGFSPQFIEYFYRNFEPEDFIYFRNINHFAELEGLVQEDGFRFERLARYIWHMNRYQTSAAIAIANINDDYDVDEDVDYSAFYHDTKTISVSDPFTVLVNKENRLPADYVPENLTEIPGEYRDSNEPLVQEACEAFTAMCKAYMKEHSTPIISYSGYISYDDQKVLYENRLAQLDDNAEELDRLLGKEGCDEHQTGLAVNITEKGTIVYDFPETDACKWVKENCREYGFILRYPKDKDYLTGYRANDYHYRYVGTEAARVIKKFNWCYEEYYYLFIEH